VSLLGRLLGWLLMWLLGWLGRFQDCHARFRTESHGDVVGRFNERFILSLASCPVCCVADDELNILPLSSLIRTLQPLPVRLPLPPLLPHPHAAAPAREEPPPSPFQLPHPYTLHPLHVGVCTAVQ